jgi:hypothetical protein
MMHPALLDASLFLSFRKRFLSFSQKERKGLRPPGSLKTAVAVLARQNRSAILSVEPGWFESRQRLRPPGFEPGLLAWKAKVLPLDYGRMFLWCLLGVCFYVVFFLFRQRFSFFRKERKRLLDYGRVLVALARL